MAEPKPLHLKLQLKSGSQLWTWPEDATLPAGLEANDDFRHATLNDADVAVLFTSTRADVDAVLSEHRAALADKRAVWIIYAKANKTDMNRDTLWVQLDEYGWRAVSQVSVSETDSAIRIRPLKEGERPRGL